MFSPSSSSSSRVFYALLGKYRKINISMGNISVGREYLPILRDNYISKVYIKVYDTVDDNNSPGVIDGCAVTIQV